MPRINFTSGSPVISYVGYWGDSDTGVTAYANSTFHFTNIPNAYLSFQFNGTGASLYGALRLNHDEFTVTVDGGHQVSANGHTDLGAGVYNVTLYSSGSLPYGTHEIAFTNTPGPAGGYVDLDWAVVEIGDGDATTPNTDFWLDDSAANFTYGDGWGAAQSNLSPQYYNNSFYVTNTDGAQATFDFYGNGVQLYGAAALNHGMYTVSLDGGKPVSYNGTEVTFRPQQLLYLASGLSSGAHRVVLSNVGSTYTDLDYAIVSQYGGSPVPAPPFSSAGPSALPSATALVSSASGQSALGGSVSGSSTPGTFSNTYGPGPSPTPLSLTPTALSVTGTGTRPSLAVGTATKSSGAAPRSCAGATMLGLLGICSALFGAL